MTTEFLRKIDEKLSKALPWYTADSDGTEIRWMDEPGMLESKYIKGAGWWESHGLKVIIGRRNMRNIDWRKTKEKVRWRPK